MTDESWRGGQPPGDPPTYPPPGDSWAVPASPVGQPYIGPPYIPPPEPTGPTRSRSLTWIAAVIVVAVLAI
jgi:hypothetical protein